MKGKGVAQAVAMLMLIAPRLLATSGEVRDDEKGTYLGVLFSPRSAPVRERAGSTPTLAGVIVTHVIPGSPAAQADLRRNDVLLRYDRQPIRDSEQLANLIRADKPERKVQLLVQRGDKQQTLEATLAVGPVLKLSSPEPARLRPATGPAAVTIYAAPQVSGKMRLTIEYYTEGKLQTVTCEGVAAELATTVQKLPERERDLVRIALQRLNKLNSEKAPVRR